MAKKPTKKSNNGRRKQRRAGGTLDYLTLIGVTLAVGAIVGGNWLEGGHVSALMQLTAFPTAISSTCCGNY